ncbi:hypothetical protein ACGFJT_37440 [Actinomadura geliboluensis]|uniref:hypothetical protein n=1 Tax=Actinomadura geliboluensis TaxID=882440 RepID=UPI0037129EB2
MALIGQVEFLGAAIEDGIITRQAAAELLVQHADGSLKTPGALSYLNRWRTLRADRREQITGIAALLACLEDVERAVTDEEKGAAELQLQVEVTRQQGMQRQRDKELRDRHIRRENRRERP